MPNNSILYKMNDPTEEEKVPSREQERNRILRKSMGRCTIQQHRDGNTVTNTYDATIHLERGRFSLQQNALPIPQHLQNHVKNELA